MILRIFIFLYILCFSLQANTIEQEVFKKIDKFVKYSQDKANLPAISIGIVQGDKLVYKKSYSENINISTESLYFIGSLTKSFTALAIMQLVEQGKITLDDSVQKHLPWFEIKNKKDIKDITIKTLLNQTSGFSTYEGLKNFDNFDSDKMVLENTIRELKSVNLKTKPSTSFEYSNINYQILGLIIEKVSGKSYEEFLKKNIFNKLVMNNTYASMDNIDKDTLAKGHFLYFGQAIEKQYPFNHAMLPAGYIISNVEDMAKYLLAHINKEEKLLNKQSFQKLHTPSATLVKDKIHYSFGWFVDTSEQESYLNHFGSTPGYSSSMIVFPKRKLGIIVLINTTSYTLGTMQINNLAGGIIDIIDAKALKEHKADLISIGTYLLLFGLIILQLFLLNRSRKKLKTINSYKALILPFIFDSFIVVLLYFIIPRGYNLTFNGFLMFTPDVAYMMLVSIFLAIYWGVFRTYKGIKRVGELK